jgi:hypothetical protein
MYTSAPNGGNETCILQLKSSVTLALCAEHRLYIHSPLFLKKKSSSKGVFWRDDVIHACWRWHAPGQVLT